MAGKIGRPIFTSKVMMSAIDLKNTYRIKMDKLFTCLIDVETLLRVSQIKNNKIPYKTIYDLIHKALGEEID